jgi:glycosyltransferase involved in cell wall biosynthesis
VQYDAMAALYGHRPDRRGPVAAVKHGVNRRLFQQAGHTVAWSSWAAESLIADYDVPRDRISVIPPGVDLSRWRTDSRPAGPVARILFVGGHFFRKGGDKLLSAFAQLPQGSAELDIVTRTAVDSAPGVRVHRGFTPNSPALAALFSSSDLFVMASGAETFGIAAVEAAASGLPVVASSVGGLHDIVVDGHTGFLVDPSDSRGLTDRIRCLVHDPALRTRMGAAGRRHAEVHFDAAMNAGRLAQILRTVGDVSEQQNNQT